MKKTKRFISFLLVIQMMLMCTLIPGAMATDAMMDETVIESETTEELMPMMARGCGYGNLTSWYNIDHATKSLILSDVSGNYSAVVGNNPDIYYGSNGLIYLCGTGSYSGNTYATDLQRSWYL